MDATPTYEELGTRVKELEKKISEMTHTKENLRRDLKEVQELERRVEERTAELLKTNELLTQERRERKQAEKALQKSETRYRTIVEAQTELICRSLPDGTLTFVNGAYCRYFGKTLQELVGKKFMPLIPEEDHEKVETYFKALSRENPVATHEHRVIAPGDEIRWQQWNNRAVFDGHGEIVEYQAVGRDITDYKRAGEALRESEARLRTAIESLPFDFFIIDKNNRYAMQNSACIEHWGDVIGKEPEESAPDEKTLSLWKSNNRRAFSGEVVRGEVCFEAKGEERYYDNIISPISGCANLKLINKKGL